MQPTLVAYFSKGGAAGIYARTIADTLKERGFAVEVVNLHDDPRPDLTPYRNIVVGTGIRVGVVYRLGKRILRREELRTKRLAVFLASGIAVRDRERARKRFVRPLMRRFGLQPVMLDAFPGKLPDGQGRLVDHTRPDLAQEWATDLADLLET